MARFDSTCWSEVLLAAGGDRSMRQVFCQRYEPVIRAYLAARWRLPRDHDDVSDAAQEVFVHCLRDGGALGRVDPSAPGGLRAFLYGVTARTAAQIERQRARWGRDGGPRDFDAAGIEGNEATLSHAFDRAWATMLAREALREQRRLAAAGNDRMRLRLYCLEQRLVHGRWPRDIATHLDVTPQRASELLREGMRDYRAALLSVMAAHHPEETERELERRCEELAREL